MPSHSYIYAPSREMWPASSVNARIPPIPGPDNKSVAASRWIDQHRPVEQMTWCPGLPMLVRDQLISEGGWIDRRDDYFLLKLDEVGRARVVANAGGFVDPASDGERRRPAAIEGGLDLDLDLDDGGAWSLSGELGAVAFFSGEAHQTHVTAGVTWSASPSLDLSLVGLLGLFGGGDRGGVLLGVTPRVALFD